MGVLDKLRGGDLRSIGKANEVIKDIQAEPAWFDDVFKGLYTNDPCVRMRSADVIEKVTRQHPEYLEKWKDAILNDFSRIDQPEVIWHVAQICSRISWELLEREKIVAILKKYLDHKSKIVVVCVMQALAELTEGHPALLKDTIKVIRRLTVTGSPAMRSRGEKLLKRLRFVAS